MRPGARRRGAGGGLAVVVRGGALQSSGAPGPGPSGSPRFPLTLCRVPVRKVGGPQAADSLFAAGVCLCVAGWHVAVAGSGHLARRTGSVSLWTTPRACAPACLLSPLTGSAVRGRGGHSLGGAAVQGLDTGRQKKCFLVLTCRPAGSSGQVALPLWMGTCLPTVRCARHPRRRAACDSQSSSQARRGAGGVHGEWGCGACGFPRT